MRILIFFVLALAMVGIARAQSCPKDDSSGSDAVPEQSTLHGTVKYHDDLREWLGLELDHPACGQSEIQLVFSDDKEWRRVESLRGCAVTATGILYDSPTGYYSARIAVGDPKLATDPSCHPFPVKRNPQLASIPADLSAFRASIVVDYHGKGHVTVQVWRDESPSSLLQPWQAYMDYMLTGSLDVIWFNCRKGFQMGDVLQDPKPSWPISMEPGQTGTVLPDLTGKNTITFACQRKPASRISK